MSLCCQQDDRRAAVRRMQGLNGLDYVEVDADQITLTVFFLGKLPPEFTENAAGGARYLHIEGGRRVTDIHITEVTAVVDPDPEKDDCLVLRLDKYGDFSTYTLRLAGVKNIDPRYDRVDFSFKVDCPSDLDCAPACVCEPPALPAPEINYLAKDYASFRQLILDRLAVLIPDWKERHVPDIGIMLVESLAYAGDYLSYYQDAVATEAYLDTARQRISIRRHVRLVDYFLHEGCNARAWVCVAVSSDLLLDAAEVAFITGINNALPVQQTVLSWDDLRDVAAKSYEVFEPLQTRPPAKIQLRSAHNEIYFYTWGEKECCLERGSTSATLLDAWVETNPLGAPPAAYTAQQPKARALQIAPGDVLIFEEVRGAKTGLTADADPGRRHAVRLTRITPGDDRLFLDDQGRPTPYVEVEWAREDALPFPFCISAIGAAPDCRYLENVSVARGNVIAVDHGKTQDPENLGQVPVLNTEAACDCAGKPGEIQIIAGRFRPRLKKVPLTFHHPLDSDQPERHRRLGCASFLEQSARLATPHVRLFSLSSELCRSFARDALSQLQFDAVIDDKNHTVRLRFPKEKFPAALLMRFPDGELPAEYWQPRYDLLASGPEDRHFVVEIDNEGVARLRFGDDELGYRPPAGALFWALYRTGNGASGNVGAESIARLVLKSTRVSGVAISARNPLPARGGIDPEPVAEAKLFAPHLFRKQIERAVVADDYEKLLEQNPEVQRASAALVWTGSWYEAVVAVDPFGRETADARWLSKIKYYLERYRRMGHDLAVVTARYVPLDLRLEVCALPSYERAHVKAALLDVFSTRLLAGGKRGFFHPNNLSFGEGIFLSQIVAAAQAVPGVECARVTKFQRLFGAANFEIENGILPLRTLEIAQLDNGPNFPERGKLEIVVAGGR